LLVRSFAGVLREAPGFHTERLLTVEVPLPAGRFDWTASETLARQFFPNVDPTTRRLLMNVTQPHPDNVEITGVVGDVRELGLDQPPAPTIYSIAASPRMTLLLKTANGQDLRAVIPSIRDAIHGTDAEIAVPLARPLEENVARSLA
jgi:hypothetical protein